MATVSVIMPAYNSENFIRGSISSVLRQTYVDFELIVINDCSIDSTQEIVLSMANKDQRILLLQNDTNRGVSYSRNYGISRATSEWIAFLDSDDMWREDKLEKQMSLIHSNPHIVLTYTASSFISFEGHPYSYIMEVESKINFKILLKKNMLSCSSVIVKRDVISRIKMTSDKMHEDYSAWLLILREIDYAYGINEPLLIYRLSKNSKSSNRLKSAKMIFNSYRFVGYGFASAIYLMFLYSFHSINKRYRIKRGRK